MEARRVDSSYNFRYRYSICSLVTNPKEYKEMCDSFINAGFDSTNSEFLYIDNSHENVTDAFRGLNLLLQEALGEYIILCHQDVLLTLDPVETLDERIGELNELDEKWAVCSNAGGIAPNNLVYNVSYSSTERLRKGTFPTRVYSVDEHFIVVKKQANLSLSADISGFHLYGTDLCIIADILGFSCYAIDFELIHKSRGKVDKQFHLLRKKMRIKYQRALRGRFIQTTITRFYLSGCKVKNTMLNSYLIMFLVRMFNGLKKRLH